MCACVYGVYSFKNSIENETILSTLFVEKIINHSYQTAPELNFETWENYICFGLIFVRLYSGFFLFATASRLALGPTYPRIQSVQGVKRLDCEADHSPPCSTQVTNGWFYTSTPPIRIHVVVLN
jgi:hypothetical protein